MEEIILAVDTNLDVHISQMEEWKKHGIHVVRVDTMHEAIALLKQDSSFLFVAINEDSIPGFMSQLGIMHDVSNIPIYVITSTYTNAKKIMALDLGADGYDSFGEFVQQNVLGALKLLELENRREKRKHRPLPVLLTGHNVILSPARRTVFIKDTQVFLTKNEFDVLFHLMRNSGHVVEHEQLLEKVWGSGYSNMASTDLLWRTIERLRRKLYKASPTETYIKVERGVGYQFLP